MDCKQKIEKSKRIFCSWTSVPALSEYVTLLRDRKGNVIESIRVKEPHVSFHGRLLMFHNPYYVQVGNLERQVILRGTSVLIASRIASWLWWLHLTQRHLHGHEANFFNGTMCANIVVLAVMQWRKRTGVRFCLIKIMMPLKCDPRLTTGNRPESPSLWTSQKFKPILCKFCLFLSETLFRNRKVFLL